MTRWGSFPLGIGNKIMITLHQPISVKDTPFQELFEQTEKAVTSAIIL
jgi:1-acyl-sn-glycerol-3-phosphate acyltransferase